MAKFFPPAKAAIAAFEEELLARVAPADGENPLVFDDEYISTGGQLYELLVGHDRFLADLRPVFFEALGLPKKLVCHPYDICVELIARNAGVIVTDENGQPLSAPLDIRADVSWCGYANAALQAIASSRIFKNCFLPWGRKGRTLWESFVRPSSRRRAGAPGSFLRRARCRKS